jgi:WxcM-like, C-terminal
MSTFDVCRTIQLPKVIDTRGNLTFVEPRHVDFDFRRVYWIYDVPGGEYRAGHAYHSLREFVIAASGSFDVELDDGVEKRVIPLNRSYYGLYVPPMMWRQLQNFSTNSVCLVLASAPYDEADYIRDYDTYRQLRAAVR